jgi:hypothetical protein
MADEHAAMEEESLWADDLFGDAPLPDPDFYEPVQWPDALEWPPAPPPLTSADYQPPAPADAAPPLDLDLDLGGVVEEAEAAEEQPLDATAAVPVAALLQPDVNLELIPDSIWGHDPATPVDGDLSAPPEMVLGEASAPPRPEEAFELEPIPDSIWERDGEEEAVVVAATAVAGPPTVYAEPERQGPTRVGGWFQVRHPNAAMAGLAVFVALVIVGLVLSVRSRPDASPTDAADRGGAIAAQRLPGTTVALPGTTTTVTTTPAAAAVDLQPPATDGAAAPADTGGTAPAAPASTGTGRATAPATTTPARSSAPTGGSGGGGGGGGNTPAPSTATTAAPPPETTSPPATSPPATTGSTSPATSTPRRSTTIPTDLTVPSVTTPPTTPAPGGPEIPSVTRPSIPSFPGGSSR